jgi:hypothetical protein
LDELLGRDVKAPDGSRAGHLHEVRVERRGEEYVVTDYLIGIAGLLVRLGVEVWRSHAGGSNSGYVVAWHQLDLSDPRSPRLKCPVSELRKWPERG